MVLADGRGSCSDDVAGFFFALGSVDATIPRLPQLSPKKLSHNSCIIIYLKIRVLILLTYKGQRKKYAFLVGEKRLFSSIFTVFEGIKPKITEKVEKSAAGKALLIV